MSDTDERRGLTSLTDYQQYVPGRVTLRDGEEDWSDLRLRSRTYAAVEPPAPVPALPQHTLTVVYAGPIAGARRTGGGVWRPFDTEARGHVTMRPAGRSTTLRWRAERPVRTLSLYLAPDRLEETGLEMGMAPSQIELRDAFNRRDPVLRRLAEAFRDIAAGGRADDPLYRQTALQALTVRLLRRHGAAGPGPEAAGQLSRDRFRRVERYVRAHLGTDLSLADLAETVGLSKYYFSRRFKQRTGQSPYQFVIYERVRAARRRLRETTQPIAQIALETGFSSQSHLTRTFKQHVGAPPGRYRRAWR
jgi:AraC family transcriptional regulator